MHRKNHKGTTKIESGPVLVQKDLTGLLSLSEPTDMSFFLHLSQGLILCNMQHSAENVTGSRPMNWSLI